MTSSGKTVVILAPMKVELAPVVKQLVMRPTSGPRSEHEVSLSGTKVVALLAGVGPAAAIEATTHAIERHAPTHILVSGVAGGMAASLSIGDLVTPEEVVDHGDGASFTPTPVGADRPEGRVVTTISILSPAELQAEIDAGFLAVDMETAAIGRTCEAAGIPWTAYRGISDLLSEGLVDESALQLVKTDGSTNYAGVARMVLRRPWILPRLARMGRDGQKATTAAARAAAAAARVLAAG